MPPRRKAVVSPAAGQQVAMPPSWMIQEAARAATVAAEEFARIQNSPGRCKSPVSSKTSVSTPGAVCRCGQRILPNSQFCTACGQSVHKRGALQDPVQNQKRQKKNTKLTTWRCEYKHGVDIRAGPDINESRVPHALEPGEEFVVEREETGADGVLYLKLADGRGWVFDQKPNWGVICAPCKDGRKASARTSATTTLKPEKVKPNQRKAKAKGERPQSERSERSRSQKKAETPKQRRSSSSQRRSGAARDEKAEKGSGPGSARRSLSRPPEDLATPTTAPERGRSPTPRSKAAPRGNHKSQDAAKRRSRANHEDELKGKETPRKSAQKSTPTTPVTPTTATVLSPMMAMLRSPKIDVPRTSPKRRPEESPRRPVGLVAAATAASRAFGEGPVADAPPPKIDAQLLATPPKEPNTRRRARSTAPQAEDAARPSLVPSVPASRLIPPHVRAMLAKPVRSRSLEPVTRATKAPKDLVVEISSEESVKEEVVDPVFENELHQFRQRQEMERSAKSAWQAAQRLAEEAERQRLETKEKSTAAEQRALEVESALQHLRQAVAQVEQRSAERVAKLRQEREAAEAKTLQTEADLKEDSGKVERVHEEGARRLELLEEELAQKLRSDEVPLLRAEEALKDKVAKAKSKIQGKILQLEKKAAAERRAVEEEAVAQRAVAPQLAALKSEVLATERGATEAEEARKRSEQRASSEEARLDAFLKRLPQLEVEASQKGEALILEAREKASSDVAEAKFELRRYTEDASRRMVAARQSVDCARSKTEEQIERHLDASHAADAEVLQAMEEEKTSEERAAKVVAAAERDAPGVQRLTQRFQAEQLRCQVAKRCRNVEKRLAEDLKELKQDHAEKVLSAARASETAAHRSQEAIEAAKMEMEHRQKEMMLQREEADAKVAQMDQKAQATGIWSQEVRNNFDRLLRTARENLLEQKETTEQEEQLEEDRHKERLATTRQLLKETEVLASVAEEDGAERTARAQSEVQEAAEEAARRKGLAQEAEEAAQWMAKMEMDATQKEVEETCQIMWLQTDEIRETCLQQQREAVESVAEVRSSVAQAIASARARLAAIQSCAAAAARDVRRAQQEEQVAAEKLEKREIDFMSAVEELAKAELQKTSTTSRCQELVVAAQQSASRAVKRSQETAEAKQVEEEDRAQRAEELAQTLEGQALCAEEVAACEWHSQQQELRREEQRIEESVRDSSKRTVNVQDAIHEAIHYSQKSLDELYRYLGVHNAQTPSPQLLPGPKKGCPKCNIAYTPTSSYCQQCGVKLEVQLPSALRSPAPAPRIQKICSRSYGRVRRKSRGVPSPLAGRAA